MRVLLFLVAAVSALTINEQKNRPVTKVIQLLKDMQANLQKEAEEDEKVYNKLACWCNTNDKEKTKAIATAEATITQLTSDIEEFAANSARLTTEIAQLEKEVEASKQSLAQATELRRKESAEFNAEEKDSLQSIAALKSAITVLSKHHKQPDEASLAAVMQTVNRIATAHPQMISAHAKDTIGAFLQQSPDGYLGAEPIFKTAYAPQSGEIFGILGSMLDTFQANLSQSQKDEMAAQGAFGELKASKEAEISEGTAHAESKRQEKATADESNANAKEDLDNTRNSLTSDQKFLMDLKKRCQMTDNEWEQRQKTRSDEMVAVSEALSVLAHEDSHDTFTRTFNFVQVDDRRERAAQVLKVASAKLASPALSALATSVRLDAFTRVTRAIDDMVKMLIKEKADEITHRDFCIDGMNTNDKENALKLRTKQELETNIDTLTSQINTLSNELKDHESEIAELQKQMKRAGEDRAAENIEFQATVKDQRATKQLLTQALDVLKGFYAKKNQGSALMQQEPAGPPPPAGFKEYKKQEGAGGVFALIQQIISDASVMEAEAVQAEKDSQTAYESYVKNTNDSILANQQATISKQSVKAKKEKSLSDNKNDHDSTLLELEQLSNEAADYQRSCSYILKNFDVRQEARDEEVEALRQAKSILSGANFGAFLQRRV